MDQPERAELLEELLDDYLHALTPPQQRQLMAMSTADLLLLIQTICHTLDDDWFERGRAHALADHEPGEVGE